MDAVFKALADPTRRELLDELYREDGQTLHALEERFPITRFGVMKHLRQLEQAGLLITQRRGREKLHFLNPVPIRLIHDRWVSKYAGPWAAERVDLKHGPQRPMQNAFDRDEVETERGFPQIRQVVLDCLDTRSLAEFYRQLLGFRYRPGDDVPDRNGDEWLVLQGPDGRIRVAFQQVSELTEPTWPEARVPQQLHLDLTVATTSDLDTQHSRALALGARLLLDRADDDEEPLRVYADPAGHPFCIFVVTGPGS